METISPRKPVFRIIYESRDITADISDSLISVNYTDNEHGKSDEIDIKVEDIAGLWQNAWYPTKGSRIELHFGYNDALTKGGVFEIDEIEFSTPPDCVSIKALAVALSKNFRTKQSRAFENLTLRQVAEKVAKEQNLKIIGNIKNVAFKRVTQNRESDLAFLMRIADEYGYIFNVRDDKMIFMSRQELDNGRAITTLKKSDLINFSIRDKTNKIYKKASVAYKNRKTKKTVKKQKQKSKEDSSDELNIRTRTESKQQADMKAEATLYKLNSVKQEGSISVIGNPLLVAGSNFMLDGIGILSGKFHITTSRHSISKSGYTTSCDIKRIAAR